jgi:hypothetical protein
MQGKSKFNFNYEYEKRDLKYLLNSIYFCYTKIISEVSVISHKENDIRDLFISKDYLNNFSLKAELNIKEFLFDKEIETIRGRADIRILNMVENMLGIQNPYYFIECKVLDNSIPSTAKSNLYSKYIINGVNRYIEEVYPTHNEANGMIGFFIKPTIIKEKCKHFTDLEPYRFIDNFEFSYRSNHITKSNKNIILYHLMLDFSGKINKR